jgi:hypothetical protein
MSYHAASPASPRLSALPASVRVSFPPAAAACPPTTEKISLSSVPYDAESITYFPSLSYRAFLSPSIDFLIREHYNEFNIDFQ